MNATIAVALITALSTLAGVTLSGIMAFLVSKSQNKVQKALASSAQEEQYIRDVCQIRRDCYVQFLNEVSLIEHELEKCWLKSAPTADIAIMNDPTSIAGKLDPLFNLVTLEGPDDVAYHAKRLEVRLILEAAKLRMLLNETGVEFPLGTDRGDVYMEMHLERDKAKSELIMDARRALTQVKGQSQPSLDSIRTHTDRVPATCQKGAETRDAEL
jgi:hypothetical protein